LQIERKLSSIIPEIEPMNNLVHFQFFIDEREREGGKERERGREKERERDQLYYIYYSVILLFKNLSRISYY
jgi:hypothetical protein